MEQGPWRCLCALALHQKTTPRAQSLASGGAMSKRRPKWTPFAVLSRILGLTEGIAAVPKAGGPWLFSQKPILLGSRVQAAHLARLKNSSASDDERRGSHGNLVLLGDAPNGGERLAHHALQTLIDFVFRPEEARKTLDPLKIGNRDAAGVGHHVGDHQDASLAQNVISRDGRGAIGALHHNFGPDARGVILRDLAFEGRGDQDVAFDGPEFLAPDRIGFGEALHA